MKDPCIFNPKLPEPRFSDPNYKPDFGPPLNDLELRNRLRDANTFLFTRQSGSPNTTTVVAQAPARLVYYFFLSISREAKDSRRFDVSRFNPDAVRLAVAWMIAGGSYPLQSLTPPNMPIDDLIILVKQVLHFSNTFRILALSWTAGEFLDGFTKAEGMPERLFRGKICGELESRWKRSKADYFARVKEREREGLEEAATNAGETGCLAGCLGFLVCFDCM